MRLVCVLVLGVLGGAGYLDMGALGTARLMQQEPTLRLFCMCMSCFLVVNNAGGAGLSHLTPAASGAEEGAAALEFSIIPKS